MPFSCTFASRWGWCCVRYEMFPDPLTTERAHKHSMMSAVSSLGIPPHFDEELLFWAQHFDGLQWATYDNGHRKGGTLRFKTGVVRLPGEPRLLVYETEERKKKRPFPYATVDIAKVTVCPVEELSQEELFADGFENHDHVVDSMKKYYPTIALDSIVSFYEFGETQWRVKSEYRWVTFGDSGWWSKKDV